MSMIQHAPAIKATELLGKPSENIHPICFGTPWMLWWIVGVHVAWGFGLLFRPEVLQTIVILIGVDWITDAGASSGMLGSILLIVSLLASIGLIIERQMERKKWKYSIWIIAILICPQYFIVLAAFISDINTLANSNFQGREVERWLLFCALAPVIWGALLHTAAILERYALVWRRQ